MENVLERDIRFSFSTKQVTYYLPSERYGAHNVQFVSATSSQNAEGGKDGEEDGAGDGLFDGVRDGAFDGAPDDVMDGWLDGETVIATGGAVAIGEGVIREGVDDGDSDAKISTKLLPLSISPGVIVTEILLSAALSSSPRSPSGVSSSSLKL